MPTTYVKKVCSYNPTQYKYITLKTAVKQYNTYFTTTKDKNFIEWLKTEI